jgi:hypothetical protein
LRNELQGKRLHRIAFMDEIEILPPVLR